MYVEKKKAQIGTNNQKIGSSIRSTVSGTSSQSYTIELQYIKVGKNDI